jgi:hypothetical protein
VQDNVPQTPPEQPTVKPAGELAAGDRIAAKFLPHRLPAVVEYVRVYSHRSRVFVLVVHEGPDGIPDIDFWVADAKIPVDHIADPDHGRTTAVAQARPDTLGVPLGRAAQTAGGGAQ